MAEAFCKWDDEKTGLNPFIPINIRIKGIGNAISKYVVGSVLLLVRLIPVSILLVLLAVSQCIGSLMLGSALRYLFWVTVISPLCKLLLVILGSYPISVSYGEAQKLRIRSVVESTSASLSDIKRDDVIVSNFLGYLQIIAFASLKSDRFGFVNSQGNVIECGLFVALKQAMFPSRAFFDKPGNYLQSVHGYCPLVLFSEGLPTNNRAILQFSALHSTTYASFPSNLHLMAMTMNSSYTPGSYLVGGAIIHLFSLMMQRGVSISIVWLCNRDLAILSPPVNENMAVKPKLTMQVSRLNNKVSEKMESQMISEIASLVVSEKCNRYFYEEKYPELLAAMIQTKVVHMNKEHGFEFIDYYHSRENKKQN